MPLRERERERAYSVIFPDFPGPFGSPYLKEIPGVGQKGSPKVQTKPMASCSHLALHRCPLSQA